MGPDAAITGDTTAVREPIIKAPIIKVFFIPFSSQIRNSVPWQRTAGSFPKEAPPDVSGHGVADDCLLHP